MNRASLDRGFGRCIVLRKMGTSLKKYANRTQVRTAVGVGWYRWWWFGGGVCHSTA